MRADKCVSEQTGARPDEDRVYVIDPDYTQGGADTP